MKDAWERLISMLSSRKGLRIFSLASAVGLWFFVNVGQKPAEWPFQVPVEFRNIPPDIMIVNPPGDQVEVRLMGPPAVLSTVEPASLRIVLDLEGARPGNSTFRLGPDYFNPPRGVRVTRVTPSVITLRFDSVAVRQLPVTVRFAGVPSGYRISRLDVTPATVRVRGPAQEINKMVSLETEPVELEGKAAQFKKEVRLFADGKPISIAPDRVTVLLTLEEEVITKEFVRVEVKAKNSSGRYVLSPGSVYLRLSGPKRILEQLQIGEDEAYLDLKGLEPGHYTVELSLRLPSEIKVLEQKPERFKVRISSPTA